MGYAFRTSAPVVEHPAGTVVAKPRRRDGCWGCVSKLHGNPLRAPRACHREARAGYLTCTGHRASEAEAQGLRAAVAAGGK